MAIRRQGISKLDRRANASALLDARGYIRGDQELINRVKDGSSLKKQLDGTGAIKTTLIPSYMGYASPETASLYRAAKAGPISEPAKTVLGIIRRDQPVSKKDIISNSPYSQDATSDAISELVHASIIGQQGDSRYIEIRDSGMDRTEALKEVIRRHFDGFGSFSADLLTSFLDSGCRMAEVRRMLAELEDEGFLKKGFFMEGDPTLRWMKASDIGKEPLRFSEAFVLNSQDNLSLYLRDMIKARCESARSVIIHGTSIIGSFRGKICASGAKVEEFEGSDRASRVMKEAAQVVGVRIESQRERDDDDWDVSEFYSKLNLGS